MPEPAQFTLKEILSQPAIWKATLETLKSQADQIHQFFSQGAFDFVITTGCGSTYYLAQAAAAAIQDIVGVPARPLPASEIWLYPTSAYPLTLRPLLIAISRSGETTETLRAIQAFHGRTGGKVLTLSCYPGREMTTLGDLNLVYPDAQEDSVAQTRAFTSLYLAALGVTAYWAGREDLQKSLDLLPNTCEKMLQKYSNLALELGRSEVYDRYYFLGSGLNYGLACELSLKMKEMSLSHSEPFHFMEFRHGPMSMVTPTTLIIGLVSERGREQEELVLKDMQARGAHILGLAESGAEIAFESGALEPVRGVLYLPLVQLLALEHALSKGLDPDQPHNLSAVIKLQ